MKTATVRLDDVEFPLQAVGYHASIEWLHGRADDTLTLTVAAWPAELQALGAVEVVRLDMPACGMAPARQIRLDGPWRIDGVTIETRLLAHITLRRGGAWFTVTQL